LPFREPALSLRDILEGIDMIVEFVGGMDLEAFREDPKTVAAVERKLLLVSEAGRSGSARTRSVYAPACRGTISAASATGSGIATTEWMSMTVWNTVIDDLPRLRGGVLRALRPPPASPKGPAPG
jgi:uncharacterized protein with HEPN domain